MMPKQLRYSVGPLSESEWLMVARAVRAYQDTHGMGYMVGEYLSNFPSYLERARREALQAQVEKEYMYDI